MKIQMGFSCQLHMPTSPLEFLNFDINTFAQLSFKVKYTPTSVAL